ncbi:MAG: nitrite reductase small subunit NirD [Pseudomonadales bacterium]|nr:nitrite reductase small subunit NirD [Pseudomonadales bacterium]
MSAWTTICSKDDLQPNSGICALVGGKQIAIFYMPQLDAVYAIDNWDPIGKANVLSRGLIGDTDGAPMVASPLYKQHFDLASGQCAEEEDVKVATYEIQIKDGKVEIKA